MKIKIFLLILGMLLLPTQLQAKTTPDISVKADVIRVIDGDTILVKAHPWLDQTITTKIRLRGLDTPEMKTRCKSKKEQIKLRKKAILARDILSELIGQSPVYLENIKHGKWGGRMLAKVSNIHYGDLSKEIIKEGLGRPYDGKKRDKWCIPPDRK